LRRYVESWLRVDRDERRVREAKELANPTAKKDPYPAMQSRHMAYYR
jgi:CCR4-NOT complex subunit CAF16